MINSVEIKKEACYIQGLDYPEELHKLDVNLLIRLTVQRCINITNGSIIVEPGQVVSGEGALLLRAYFGV
jgi:hypothetical protein